MWPSSVNARSGGQSQGENCNRCLSQGENCNRCLFLVMGGRVQATLLKARATSTQNEPKIVMYVRMLATVFKARATIAHCWLNVSYDVRMVVTYELSKGHKHTMFVQYLSTQLSKMTVVNKQSKNYNHTVFFNNAATKIKVTLGRTKATLTT